MTSGLKCKFSSFCSFYFSESESLELMLTQSFCMEKIQDYFSKADSSKEKATAMTILLSGLECDISEFLAFVLLNPNHLGSCSHNLFAWIKFKITIQRQTLAKTNANAIMT